MGKVWFTSDTHYAHNNISGPDTSTWSSGFRNFKNTSLMNETIIETFNKYVEEDDILYHLGDWSFGNKNNVNIFRNSLICKNVHIFLGNHDNPENFTLENFSSIRESGLVRINGIDIFLSHYPHRTWNKCHKGSIHLYGHEHGMVPDWGKSMDVGIDVAYKKLKEWRPFSLDEIIKIMEKREIIKHH